MATVQRRCQKCDSFLPNLVSDPHPLCPRCRGVKCERFGKRCNFCTNWPDDVWLGLKPVPRPYAARNPLIASKKPGKPLKRSLMRMAEKPRPITSFVDTAAGTSANDTFVDFVPNVSPYKHRLDVLMHSW